MRGHEPGGKNHSTECTGPHRLSGETNLGAPETAYGDGCLGKVKGLPADILPHRDPYMEAIGAGFSPLPDDPEI